MWWFVLLFFICVFGLPSSLGERKMCDDKEGSKGLGFVKTILSIASIAIVVFIAGWGANELLSNKAKTIVLEQIKGSEISINLRIDDIHLILLQEEKALCERLLEIEKKCEIDSESTKRQLNAIDGRIEQLRIKKTIAKYKTQDSVLGIIETKISASDKITVKDKQGKSSEYWITASTRFLKIQSNMETEGSRADLKAGSPVMIVPVSGVDNGEPKKANLILVVPTDNRN